jgi:hypothetical protein
MLSSNEVATVFDDVALSVGIQLLRIVLHFKSSWLQEDWAGQTFWFSLITLLNAKIGDYGKFG